MPNPTPGQICYDAWRALQRRPWLYDCPLPWEQLHTSTQAAWEAAAQAVLDAALADRVWARQAPSSRWQVVPPPQDAPC
jgi:hypothetical protein